MKTYEYRVPTISEVVGIFTDSKSEAEIESKLDRLDAQGWQIAAYSPRFDALILMRERPTEDEG